jgi:uncharacterized membrane protein
MNSKKTGKNLDNELLNRMSRDPEYWRGPLYFNRKDPRLSVPKLEPSLGWTLNFAHPVTYIVVIGIIAVVIIVSIVQR